MEHDADAESANPHKSEWLHSLAQYERPDRGKAIGQLLTTLLPYFAVWGLMIFTVMRDYAYGITLALAVIAAGLLVRISLIFHDCSHGSFFPSPRANRLLGYITGLLIFTPFDDWQWGHRRHHAHLGNLDQRGVGDIYTMTVEEYRTAPRLRRITYGLYRHPAVMFGLFPTLVFLLMYRFPTGESGQTGRFSVLMTNAALVVLAVIAQVTVGTQVVLAVAAPVLLIGFTAIMWLFYVLHHFTGVYWAREPQWEFYRSAMESSAYLPLPAPLQWLTASVGLHHVHHMRPRIPNCLLHRCLTETPALQRVTPLTLRGALTSLTLRLWDEQRQQLISFRTLKARRL